MVFSGEARSRPYCAPNNSLIKMTANLWSLWITAARPALAGLKPGEWALLILLATSVVVLCAFRQCYLMLWTSGWALLASSRLVASHGSALRISERYTPVAEQASFLIAVGLLAGSVFIYTRGKNLLGPLAGVTVGLAGFAAARALLWSDVPGLRGLLEVTYRIILLTAAVSLVRARRGRWELGAWLLALSLPLQHVTWHPFTDQVPTATFAALDALLGVSILLVLFADARSQARRLAALQSVTSNFVKAQQQGEMMQAVLEELRQLTRSNAAWFRLIEGGHMVATQAVGVSQDFVREAGMVPLTESISQILEQGTPWAAQKRNDETNLEDAELLKSEKLRHLM